MGRAEMRRVESFSFRWGIASHGSYPDGTTHSCRNHKGCDAYFHGVADRTVNLEFNLILRCLSAYGCDWETWWSIILLQGNWMLCALLWRRRLEGVRLMSERVKPDIAALLYMLHEQTQQMESNLSIREAEVTLVQRISDRVASLPALPPVTPDPEALVAALRQEVRQLKHEVRFRDVGTVQYVGTGVATLSGLPRVRTDELVTFPTGVQGMILNLESSHVDVILLGPKGIQVGIWPRQRDVCVSGRSELLGRVVNPLGVPLDGEGPIEAADTFTWSAISRNRGATPVSKR
jgi:hypothetical protein